MDDLATQAITVKGFDTADAILRAAIRNQVGAILEQLHQRGTIEKTGVGRAMRWKLASEA